ncbi:uncharacterized protein N7500_007865 [Penicillium coprophilum]|uniref:uncharacterized protein n=1 Tax=Penicillium coprophilum TaxID=36646 RepID=UPI0023A22A0F|nr:uncharacterized protein N7500_007865 [Penicillium coprophilum]KAJ5158214.1 hypothetical protein N7500_007865 [Penicillium coprophilum]
MKTYERCVPFALSLFLVTPILGQGTAETLNVTNDTSASLVDIAQGGQNLCTSDDIVKMDVSGCTCPSTFPPSPRDLICVTPSGQYPINCNPPPPYPPWYLEQSSPNVTRAILCRCIRDFQAGTQTAYIASPTVSAGPPQPNQPPSRVVLGGGDLITTTEFDTWHPAIEFSCWRGRGIPAWSGNIQK